VTSDDDGELLGKAARSSKLSAEAAATVRQPPHLFHSFAWSLLSTIVYSACQLGLIINFAKWGSASIVGQFALAMSITTPIVLFANCALRTIQASDTTDQIGFGSFLAFRLLGLGAAAITIVAIACCCDANVAEVILAIGAAKCVESLGDLLQGAMQRKERLDLIGKSQVLKGSLGLIAVFIAFDCTNDLAFSCWVLAATFAVIVVGYDLPVASSIHCNRQSPGWPASGWPAVYSQGIHLCWRAICNYCAPCWNRHRLQGLARLALPMGLTVMSGALIGNICRYFLYLYRGSEELGVFAALSWFTLAGALVATALAHAALPRLSQYYAVADVARFRQLFWLLFSGGAAASLLAVAIGALAGPKLLALCYGPEYSRHQAVFVLLLLSMGFSVEICFLDHALYAARLFRAQVPMNVAVCVGMLIACSIAIPRAGLIAAAWIMLAALAAQLLLRFVIVWRILYAEVTLGCSTAANRSATAHAIAE
jgi:O-antigen/teichoic acid export membrane protein